MYTEYEIRTIPLSLKSSRTKVEKFLTDNNLRLDDVDYYAGIFPLEEDRILACGGLKKNVIKCIAVSDELQGTGMSNRLISHLISTANAQGFNSVKVFTKPTNKDIFTSLGFSILAGSPNAILLENNLKNIHDYCNYLASQKKEGTNGCIIMNCNPFTKGHRYLIEQAAKQTDNLYIIPVREDVSMFSYSERKAMTEAGTHNLKNVHVLEGSDYAVSQFTFPTYFLKNLDDAADTHITLDLDLFCRFIAPALNITERFVGSEPTDNLTRRYNELMKQILEPNGIKVTEINRLETQNEENNITLQPVSASRLRKYLTENSLQQASVFAYRSTLPYLVSYLAVKALQCELDTTPKPGLVDKQDSGAHSDMDYTLMSQSIKALHPYFTKLALLGTRKNLPEQGMMREIGLQAENAMFQATDNVNTHKGALFSMGLAVVAASYLQNVYNYVNVQYLQDCIAMLAAKFPQPDDTHGDKVLKENKIKGALYNAIDGYKELFSLWLPFYQKHKHEEYALHRLLLLIMTSIEDTNIYYRKGKSTADRVKKQAAELLENFDITRLQNLNKEYIKENISPGGAADMLSLTVFVDSVVN